MSVRVRLYRPADLAGRLICWRLESAYSHATIEIDGTIYSATVPRIVAVPLNDTEYGIPPREGDCYDLSVTAAQKARIKAYCDAIVGEKYDLLSILGWALRLPSLQTQGRLYCFESVYAALAAAGLFPRRKLLVTGDQLLVDLWRAGLIEPPPGASCMRAVRQRQPVEVI